jgi:hypothetical protein
VPAKWSATELSEPSPNRSRLPCLAFGSSSLLNALAPTDWAHRGASTMEVRVEECQPWRAEVSEWFLSGEGSRVGS